VTGKEGKEKYQLKIDLIGKAGTILSAVLQGCRGIGLSLVSNRGEGGDENGKGNTFWVQFVSTGKEGKSRGPSVLESGEWVARFTNYLLEPRKGGGREFS